MANWSFTEHPASVGETYGQHLASASGFSLRMIMGGLACLVHGLFPFLFVTTGSSMIRELHHRMVVARARGAVSDAGKSLDDRRGDPTAIR